MTSLTFLAANTWKDVCAKGAAKLAADVASLMAFQGLFISVSMIILGRKFVSPLIFLLVIDCIVRKARKPAME